MQTRAEAIGQRLVADGFTPTTVAHGTQYHHRKFMFSRFGIVDRLVTVRVVPEVDATTLAGFEQESVDAALATKVRWPRGLGSAVEVYAFTLTAAADPGAVTAATQGPRSRWTIMSTPVLIHGSKAAVTMFEGRKIWGFAYIKALRSQARTWVG